MTDEYFSPFGITSSFGFSLFEKKWLIKMSPMGIFQLDQHFVCYVERPFKAHTYGAWGERGKLRNFPNVYVAKFVCKKNTKRDRFLPAAKLRHFLGMVYRTAEKASFLPSPPPPPAASFLIYGKVFFIVQAQKGGETEGRGGRLRGISERRKRGERED